MNNGIFFVTETIDVGGLLKFDLCMYGKVNSIVL